MMAKRRSAVRSARFDAGVVEATFGETTFGVLAWAALTVARLRTGVAEAEVLGDDFDMTIYD
jgi:hypothetical protein